MGREIDTLYRDTDQVHLGTRNWYRGVEESIAPEELWLTVEPVACCNRSMTLARWEQTMQQ